MRKRSFRSRRSYGRRPIRRRRSRRSTGLRARLRRSAGRVGYRL